MIYFVKCHFRHGFHCISPVGDVVSSSRGGVRTPEKRRFLVFSLRRKLHRVSVHRIFRFFRSWKSSGNRRIPASCASCREAVVSISLQRRRVYVHQNIRSTRSAAIQQRGVQRFTPQKASSAQVRRVVASQSLHYRDSRLHSETTGCTYTARERRLRAGSAQRR